VDAPTLTLMPSEITLDKKGRIKGSKKDKRKKGDFNMRDMLPAGAVSSDDEKVKRYVYIYMYLCITCIYIYMYTYKYTLELYLVMMRR
jgi:hypothetical protein